MMERNFALAAGLCVAMMSMPAGAAEKQLNMGGSTTSSAFYPYYTAVAASISQAWPDVNVTVVSAGGYAKNDAMMRQGRMDFAGLSPDVIDEAMKRGFEYRVLWYASSAPQVITVVKDAPIKTVSDLNGRCFHPGMTGSASEKYMMSVLRVLGTEPKLHLSDPKDAISAIQNGHCLGQVKSISGTKLDAATAELHLTTPVKPVAYTDAEIAKVTKALPWMGFITIPAGIVEGAPAFKTHEIAMVFAAPSTMDEDTGYKLVKGMWDGFAEQCAAFKGVCDIDMPKKTIASASHPLHPGAVRYFRELGLEVPDRLRPPELKR